ncbi:hypothetical protein [Nocardia concava]|uniref:hypothetical protein n=1 Tax=Nocardia concava TaxID=257281 RepID=UPI0012F7785F|nr:hypothetical protein [Nocardia concava]
MSPKTANPDVIRRITVGFSPRSALSIGSMVVAVRSSTGQGWNVVRLAGFATVRRIRERECRIHQLREVFAQLGVLWRRRVISSRGYLLARCHAAAGRLIGRIG